MQAEERHGFEGDGFVYLRNPMWWAGIICCTTDPTPTILDKDVTN